MSKTAKENQNQKGIQDLQQNDLNLTQTQQMQVNHLCNELEKEEAGKTMIKEVHLTLQGKGGVGKSFVSNLLAQYLQSINEPVIAIDTDPVNATLYGFKAFDTQRLEILEDGEIRPRVFDSLIEQIVEEDSHFVIDNGASSFVPLSYYLVENDIVNLINENGKRTVVHTVVTGGQAFADTLNGLNALLQSLPDDTKIIVWLNEFFGEVKSEGKEFTQMRIYQENKDRIAGIIYLQRRTSDTFGEDINIMQDKRITFDEAIASPEFSIVAKSRIKKVKKEIFDQLSEVIGE